MKDRQIIIWQRLEGLAVLLVSLAVFSAAEGNWLWFAAGLLLPDIAMLGYLKNSHFGAFCYNLAHSFFIPAMLALLAIAERGGQGEFAIFIATVWAAHIGLDRALGYGLKYNDDFKHTHLGKIGKE